MIPDSELASEEFQVRRLRSTDLKLKDLVVLQPSQEICLILQEICHVLKATRFSAAALCLGRGRGHLGIGSGVQRLRLHRVSWLRLRLLAAGLLILPRVTVVTAAALLASLILLHHRLLLDIYLGKL